MGDGLMFATLATLIGKKNAARLGTKRVTIAAVGRDRNGRWVMATDSGGGVILGEPSDFTVLEKRDSRAGVRTGR